jgi:hypothetical protein
VNKPFRWGFLNGTATLVSDGTAIDNARAARASIIANKLRAKYRNLPKSKQ